MSSKKIIEREAGVIVFCLALAFLFALGKNRWVYPRPYSVPELLLAALVTYIIFVLVRLIFWAIRMITVRGMGSDKSPIIVEELTSGSAYNKFSVWFNDSFYVILTEKGLTIWNGIVFRKITIPKQAIQKLILEEVTFWGISQNVLRVLHSHPGVPKIIRFRPSNYDAWFEAFEKSSIPTEGLQRISDKEK